MSAKTKHWQAERMKDASQNISNGILYDSDEPMTPEDILDVVSDISRRVLMGRKIARIWLEYADDEVRDDATDEEGEAQE